MKIISEVSGSEEILLGVTVEGTVMVANTPTPTVTPWDPRPAPTPITVLASVAGYSPLLAEAMSSLPPEYDFVSDGLSTDETRVLDWADSRLFSNPNFLQSKWGPDTWPIYLPEARFRERFKPEDPLWDSELRIASAQALVLMIRETNILKRADGEHVVSW